MSHPKNTLSLVADVGGTNTRVALARNGEVLSETLEKVRNATAASLADVIAAYVGANEVDCASAAVAIAGPVHNGKGRLTNLDWSIDEDTLARTTGAENSAVLNDLQAQAFALGRIAPENLRSVLQGQAAPADAARLVIGIGTGFNAALALRAGPGRVVPASECGHATLPVRTESDLRLARFVGAKTGFASVEDALSGRGLEAVHAWHAAEAGSPSRLAAAEIMAQAQAGNDILAQNTLETFIGLMGRVAGDLALVHLPFGGIYLIGGVARAMTPYLERFDFAGHFRDKGRFAEFMDRFSVEVVEDDFAALAGLATHLADAGKN